MTRLADVEVYLAHETDRAYLVLPVGATADRKRWVPKSVAEWELLDVRTQRGIITLPEGMAIDRELI